MSEAEESRRTSKDEFIPKKQHLFLVEFLIDTVTLNLQGLSEEIAEGQTCINLKFLNFPPLTICEKDFDPGREPGFDKIRFNCGKSLMFAFTEKQCENPPPMVAEMSVCKKFDDGCDFSLGKIKICMTQLFQQVYEVAKNTPHKLPSSKSIKDCFMVIGRGKRATGEVGVYVRLTCLGQNVVTEFQCGANMKQDPVLFKNKDGKKVYEFMGADKEDELNEEGRPTTDGGCGCLGPPQNKYSGGQGDAGSRRRTSTGGVYTKGSRVVLDIPNKSNQGKGEQYANKPKQTNAQNTLTGTVRTKEGLSESPVKVDPEQNCFVLKVGDKGQIPDRGKMILEFRTPKQKIIPREIPPYHEDIAVQTDSPKKKKGKKK